MKVTDISIVNTSDTGTESHNPLIPKNIGRIIIATDNKINVLENAINAEILPLESAVNNMLENVLNPTKSSASENSLLPLTARIYVSLPDAVNTETSISDPKTDINVVNTAKNPTKEMLIFLIFLSLSFSPAP